MENTPDFPAYDDVARRLREAGVPTSASEVHGIITGVLCAPQGARVAWQELALGRARENISIRRPRCYNCWWHCIT
ncbi:MAG: hypothetical protein Tsb0026_19000 [Sulfuricaulis sp.]